MKVAVVGGYGVFGSRTAELLLRDGHDVLVAGRSLEAAEACAARLGARALRLDRAGELAPLAEAGPHVVVDAAGPFQAYGQDPYRLPRFCIAHGIDYLDLCDDTGFTCGIGALDAEARAAGRFVLSGASSVPAISSAAVSALTPGLACVDLIESAIMPGNRAPRGRSVVASILSQVGAPMRVWRGGRWREIPCWTDRRDYRLGPRLKRSAWTIGVPDLALFPVAFAARSVTFRAGLELGVMNRALSVLGLLRRAGLARLGPALVAPTHILSVLLKPFGSDVGGMVVAVTGRNEGRPVVRRWQLLAEAGEGPYVPAVPVRALLRRAGRIEAGARPCLSETTLAEIEAAMSDLAVTTSTREAPRPTLFQAALRDKWRVLPPAVRRLHGVQDVESFSGRARVERGSGVLARLAAWVFRFPVAGPDVPLAITKTRTDGGEIWERDFAGRVFRSHFTPARPYHYRERFGPFTFELELPVIDGALHLAVRRGWFLGLPIPRRLLPRSEAREFEADGAFRFDVALVAPLGAGLIVRYRGTVAPDPGDTR